MSAHTIGLLLFTLYFGGVAGLPYLGFVGGVAVFFLSSPTNSATRTADGAAVNNFASL